jgi:hypothetical protein
VLLRSLQALHTELHSAARDDQCRGWFDGKEIFVGTDDNDFYAEEAPVYLHRPGSSSTRNLGALMK